MRLRALFAAFVLVAGFGAFSMAEAQNQKGTRQSARKAAPAPQPAPPPAPVGPPSFIAPTGVEPLSYAVQSYAVFQNDFSDLRTRASLRTQSEMDAALDKVAAHNRWHLTRGLLAYGALTAAQSDSFVKGVREAHSFYEKQSPGAFIRGLMFDNGYARTLAGARDAERLILGALAADGERIIRVGDQFRGFAAGVQRANWGAGIAQRAAQRGMALQALGETAGARGVPTDAAAKLAPAAMSGSPSADPAAFGGAIFWDAFYTIRAAGAAPSVQPSMAMAPPAAAVAPEDRTLAINQIMTLAALYILDATKDPNVPISELLTEQRTANCFQMVQSQLRQCISAARFHYESAYCLAEQGMQNMGRCVKDGRLTQ